MHSLDMTQPQPYQNEEISTIFVVGFPDNMQEREFQNMFTFSTGFEAATLKIPQSMEDENGARKQIIGFAKFRTREDALRAKDMLSGRKVDADKGCTLKAEMAKKNLHTKRGLSIDHGLRPFTLPQPGTSPAAASVGSGSLGARRFTSPSSLNLASSRYDPFSSAPLASPLPSDLLSPLEYADIFSEMLSPPTPTTPGTFSDLLGRLDLRDEAGGPNGAHNPSAGAGAAGAAPLPKPPSAGWDGSRAVGFNRPSSGKNSLLEVDVAGSPDPLDYLSKSTPALSERVGGFGGGGAGISPWAVDSHAARLASSLLPSPSLPTGGNPLRLMHSANPADQNPPCNTLYVGNLPHAASEEELRQIFSRCSGYKRLCFRTKANGPMCFVEFESIEHATRALNDLQGTPLASSVKGGIRLSFSKNPLGVRQTPPVNGSTMNTNPSTTITTSSISTSTINTTTSSSSTTTNTTSTSTTAPPTPSSLPPSSTHH
ncbi:uncharacterized protein VTP21DRAFT_647 [Calcarisporiella thermophila]|uniref:uncharacterized protein n=1 Tax=Calcarisporiella thermophila TaxID=911321 RepID=UPI003743129E